MKQIFKQLWPYIRIALSLGLLWLATRGIDWQALKDTKISINPLWFGLAVLLLILTNLAAVLRWGWLMRSVKLYRPAWDYIAFYFAGGLINQGLPSIVGGDSYRAVQASRPLQDNTGVVTTAPHRLRLSFFMVALDRGLGLLGNMILGAVGLIFGGLILAPWAQALGWWALSAMLVGVVIVCVLLSVLRTRQLIQALLNKMGMPQALAGLQIAFGWPTAIAQLLISVMTHFLALTSFWCCLQAFGLSAPFSALMIGMPALGLLMILPISISGWGLREATLSATLALWGVDSGITVLASISFGIVTLMTYLPSAITLMTRGRLTPTQTPRP